MVDRAPPEKRLILYDRNDSAYMSLRALKGRGNLLATWLTERHPERDCFSMIAMTARICHCYYPGGASPEGAWQSPCHMVDRAPPEKRLLCRADALLAMTNCHV